MLTISVKNFGPIAEGSVDLKPLTIFVGPSNTGKSYMATAVYAMMKSFEEVERESYRAQPEGENKRLYWRGGSGRTVAARNGGADGADAVLNWAAGLPPDARDGRHISVSEMSGDLRSELEDSLLLLLGAITGNAIDAIEQNCGEPSEFVRRKSKPDDFCVNLHRDKPSLELVVRLADGDNTSPQFDISLSSLRQPFLQPTLEDTKSDGLYPRAAMPFLMMLDSVSDNFFAGLPPQSFYLPASRTGMARTYKVISGSLVRRSSLGGVQPKVRGTALSGIITEFLGNLISLDKRMGSQQGDTDLENAIGFIEQNVLHGEIDLDESAGLPYPEIAYESAAGKFTVEHTSSMVSELAPLILFLKYLIRPGDLLILEEPESHLHPAAQLQLARGIARLVNADVQVLITTHSADFIDQINNLISMSNVSEETWASMGLKREDCLNPEQVSAYGFRFDGDLGGSVTYQLPVGTDVGIEEEEFLPITELLYEQAITLQRHRLT